MTQTINSNHQRLRVTLLGHPDIASIYALNRLVQTLPGHDYTLFLSPAIAIGPDAHPAMQELDRLDREMLKAFDRGDYSPGGETPALRSLDGKYLQAPNSDSGLALLRDARPDLIVSIRYRKILKDEAIAVPRLGVLNLHSGILPDYRGVMATFWAMLERADEIGTTLHSIVDSGIDTGPIVSIQRKAPETKASYASNVLDLYADGVDATALAVSRLGSGETLEFTAPDHRGTYYSAPEYADIQAFLDSGLVLSGGLEPTHLKQQLERPVRNRSQGSESFN